MPNAASQTAGTKDGQHDRGDQAEEAADHGAPGGQPFQNIDMSSTGKLARGRDREGQPHHEGDVLLLEDDAEQDGDDAEHHRGDLRDAQLLLLVGAALANTRGVEVVAERRAPASVRPGTTARMVAKATAEMKPRNRLPPTALARWIAAMLPPPEQRALELPPIEEMPGWWPTRMIAPKPMMKVRM